MKSAGNIDFSREALGQLWDANHGSSSAVIVGKDNHGERVDYAGPVSEEKVREISTGLAHAVLECWDDL
jgi:hypothetical protein